MKNRNDRLRDLLREGDPAAGDPGLSPEEVQAMRRTVLSAVPEPRRRGWLVPALATAAALVLAAVLVLWRTAPETPDAPDTPKPGPIVAAPMTPAPAAEPVRPAPAPQPEPPVRIAVEKPEERPEPLAVAPAVPALPEQQAVLPAAPEGQRQIQFSTPGGTRVIWMLNPATE